MGKISRTRIGIIIGCLLLAGVFVYWQPSSGGVEKKVLLKQVLSNIAGWKVVSEIPLQKKIAEDLMLDDYAFLALSDGGESVTLYIGYYFTAKKVGAAHDPLVCFPGQGWLLSEKSKGEFRVDKGKESIVSYSSMIAQKGADRELIVYWFQSFDRTSADTFNQKVQSSLAKLTGRGEDSAFVRANMVMGDRTEAECKRVLLRFVQDFYPAFLKYVREGNENK